MCGIAGYVGPRNAIETVMDQLKRLEYRGYDSAGIAYHYNEKIEIIKKAGKLGVLKEALKNCPENCNLAIAHSRWATHGAPTDENAHPHFDEKGEIALIHNGIIENYYELRESFVQEGHHFLSQTDTEVAAHAIGDEYAKGGNLEDAVRKVVRQFRGAFALVVVSRREPGKIVAVRNASPLVLGIGKGESLLASDIPALLPFTREVVVMEENTVAVLETSGIRLIDEDGRELPVLSQTIEWDQKDAERGGFPHFMLKEIHDQPEVIRQTLAGRITSKGKVELEGLFSEHVWTEIDRVNIIACGTAYHAGLLGKHLFEKLLRLPTDVYYSSEFRYGDPVLSQKSLAIFVSQSGETADTLAALRLCKSRRIRTLGIVNVVGSSIARECDRTVFTQAGPEISVASTKAYIAQVLVFILVALHVAQVQEIPGIRTHEWVCELLKLPDYARDCLASEGKVKEIAQQLQYAKLAFFLGRGADAALALEGALKLKEIAYLPTQESPAGEMKHGPLALVDPDVIAVFGATDPVMVDKVISNIREVQARGGKVLGITTEDDRAMETAVDYLLRVPKSKFDVLSSLLSIIPLQLFAYHFAATRGCDIDQPRNLAKSVTVE